MRANKVCPIVLRNAGASAEVLAFVHPQAGFQLVKGSIEPGESLEAAALRELAEESGINQASLLRSLGLWTSDHEGQVWWFGLVQPKLPPPDEWDHRTLDGGGLIFRFFWQSLHASLSPDWHPVYQRAIAFIRAAA